MSSIDFTPLYRSSIGFDRFAHLLDSALRSDAKANNYPPYNIEVTGEDRYQITIAVAGFAEQEIDIQVEKNVLTVRAKKADENLSRQFLFQGIATRGFERKFNLADHVQVTGADLNNGLLSINLLKETPEAMKPRTVAIGSAKQTLKSVEGVAA